MKTKPVLSIIHGTGGREQLVDQLLREVLLREKSDPAVIEKLKEKIDRPRPALYVIKH